MASQKLNRCDLDSDNTNDSDIQSKSTLPKRTSSTTKRRSRQSIDNQQDDNHDDDEIISPKRNRRSVLISDDEDDHLVRLDLHDQAHEEHLESLVNLGVAERRYPVPDRMTTVTRVIDGRRVSCVEPASHAGDEGADATKEAELDGDEAEVEDGGQESGKAPNDTDNNRNSSCNEASEEDKADRDFIVDDSATPSYHESAGSSTLDEEIESDNSNVDDNDEKAEAQKTGVDKSAEAGCQGCQCRCPACRRCEFKYRKRWRRKKKIAAQKRATAGAAATESEEEEFSGKKRSRSGIGNRRISSSSSSSNNSDRRSFNAEDFTRDSDDEQRRSCAESPAAALCRSQRRKRH